MTKPHFRKHADGTVSMFVGDGFSNFMTGLGMMDLKASANTYVHPISAPELEAAYRTSTWFGKIVDIPAKDATREWRNWKADSDQIEKLDATEKRLGVQSKVLQALTWRRLYGGAAIIPGGLPGNPNMPLNMEAVRVDQIKFLTVLNKDELIPVGLIRNPMDPNYGEPEHYMFSGDANQTIHPSRVIPFNGRKVAPLSSLQDYWGDPIWHYLEAAVKSADASGAVIDALMQEAKVDVLRINGMMKGMATAEYEALMVRRFQMVALLKGMQNVMMLDKDDEWQQKQITWTGLPDIAKHVLNILSGASDIPMFRLTGQNLTGLSASGDAEMRAYYDGVRSEQKLFLSNDLSRLDEMLIRSALGTRPPEVWYDWVSLYQMTEKERAEIDKIEAETAMTYSSSNLIPPSALAKAVQSRMIESGRWSALEQALEEVPDEEEEDARLAAEVAALLQRAAGTTGQPGGDDPSNQNRQPGTQNQAVSDAAPRTLYVSRKVLNWRDIDRHYKAQGFQSTLGGEMHVTIVYSKAPVDWMKMGSSWSSELKIPAGGPRLMEAFGDNGEAKVLAFASSELTWRHQDAISAGASSDYSEYQPHITISWNSEIDLAGVEPWQGEIELGPEIFAELDPDWKSKVMEDAEKWRQIKDAFR